MIVKERVVWSPYQEAIFNDVCSNQHSKQSGVVLIKALAGSAKTTTLTEAVKRIDISKDVWFCAFNKHIAEELKTKINRQRTYISTLHAFGYSALISYFGGSVKLTNYKVPILVDELNKKWKLGQSSVNTYKYNLPKMWDLMRLKGIFEYEKVLEMCLEHDIAIKEKDFKTHFEDLVSRLNASDISKPKPGKQKEIDFVDMVYLPIKLGLGMRKFDIIFVDEAQDLSYAQKQLLLASMHASTKIYLCGDENQTIYQFLGSSEKIFNSFLELPNSKELPLNICYRCSKEVVKEAKEIVQEIEFFDGSPQGSVIRLGTLKDVVQDSFVLCRNNKPLVILFYKLLDLGVKGVCLKDKSYKEKLLSAIRPYRNVQECLVGLSERMERLVDEYRELNLSKTKLEIKLDELSELEQIIKIISKRCSTKSEFMNEVEQLFQEEGKSIYLMTIHGSKGLERKNVYLIRPDLVKENKKTTQDWQVKMNRNLHYIAITRAKENFFYIPLESFNDETEDF